MSKCTSLFNKASGCRYMARPLDCCCTDENDICVHAPTGEPRCLTLLAPVVFDECGIQPLQSFPKKCICQSGYSIHGSSGFGY